MRRGGGRRAEGKMSRTYDGGEEESADGQTREIRRRRDEIGGSQMVRWR